MTETIKQVGGDHYNAVFQHWDWCGETDLGYLEGNASKYLARFRKKHGKADLEKALSYVLKARQLKTPPAGMRASRSHQKLNKFLQAAMLSGTPEGNIIALLDNWLLDDDLQYIQTAIQELIDGHG